MAKSKLSEFKKVLSEMNEEELREELLKLYNKLPQVKEFYNQDLMTEEERQVVLKNYKSKIHKQFWTSKGNPKDYPSNAQIRTIISEYEKIAVFPYDIVDLLLYRVEVCTDYANQFGGTLDADYNASITSFKKLVKLLKQHNLKQHFEKRIAKVLVADNLDYWYIQELIDLYDEVD